MTADDRELPADLQRCRRCRQLHAAFAVVADALDEHQRCKPIEPAVLWERGCTSEEHEAAIAPWREWHARYDVLDQQLLAEIDRHCAHVVDAHPLATA